MDLRAPKKNWTVLDILNTTAEHLQNKSFESPRLNAEWLLAHTLNCRRLDLYTGYDRPLTASEITSFKALLLRRLNHEPLQYILGTTEFMGYTFITEPGVLIPRPDTEILTETVFNYFRILNLSDPVKLLDIGTGTGAIIISLSKMFEKHGIPCELWAMDINPKAVDLAVRNAGLNNSADIHFFSADVLDSAWMEPHVNSFHGVVSNPPYVSEKEFALLPDEVRLHEPKDALFADNHGLAFYERIAGIAPDLLKNSGPDAALFFETGYNQAAPVRDILLNRGFKNIEIVKDYQHIQRVIRALF